MTTVAIGMNLKEGPYGGGNQFGHALTLALMAAGINVVRSLTEPGIDLILVTEVRPWLDICAFSMNDAARYRAQHDTPIVLRVNECDERKDKKMKLLNEVLRAAVRLADHTVYISSWLQETLTRQEDKQTQNPSVIRNGADADIFNAHGHQIWDGTSPLKIVTHHWSSHRLKGWDVYELLDSLTGESLKGKIEFTYIGNIPSGIALRHSRHIPPLAGGELAQELRRHHVYVTASMNEPAGMHHIEGALSGLPLLYRESGALPEYCQGFGIAFSGPDDFLAALRNMIQQYRVIQPRLANYPHTASQMTDSYLSLFQSLINKEPQATSQQWTAELNLKAKLAALRLADHVPLVIR